MAENDSGTKDSGADLGRGIATPRRELARLRESQAEQGSDARRRFEEAVLLGAGELGYRQLTVNDVLARCKGNRAQFYRHFASKDECYLVAHGGALERLGESLLEAGAAAPSWRAGLRAALEALARFAVEQPLLARGILAEAHVAGEPALAKREEVFERLTRAIDSARRETESRHSPPPITAAFMLSAIEEAVVMALVKGEPQRFEAVVPDLAYLATMAYFGAEAAREELG